MSDGQAARPNNNRNNSSASHGAHGVSKGCGGNGKRPGGKPYSKSRATQGGRPKGSKPYASKARVGKLQNDKFGGKPHGNMNARGERQVVEEPAFEPLPAQFPLQVSSLNGGTCNLMARDAGVQQFAARLRKVAKERRKWARDNDVSCYRVYDADLPDFAVAVDIYEGTWKSEGETCLVIAEYQAPKNIDAARAAARFDDAVEIAQATFGIAPEHVFSKTRRREKGGGQYTDQQKQGHVLYTQEAGNIFECDLGSYLDTGIFLDHRDTRCMVGDMAAGKTFLNLFAYTGTATVHAAVGGAKSTLTVDMSQTYLAWAQRNMALNGCDGSEHRFERADVLQWIERAVAGYKRYDLIFVDPPTFSNSKAMGKNTWSVQRDHVKLLGAVAHLLEADGVAVFSCNLRNFKPDVEALAAAGVQIEDISARTIPHDFERNPRIHCCYLVRKKRRAFN